MVDLFLDPNHEKGPSCHHRSLSVTFFVRALFRDTKSPFSVSALLYRVLASLHHYINLATHVREGKSLTAAMQLRLETEGNRPRGILGLGSGSSRLHHRQPRCQGRVSVYKRVEDSLLENTLLYGRELVKLYPYKPPVLG